MRLELAASLSWVIPTLSVASASAAVGTGELRQPIIYGEDDRQEVYEVESDILQARARQAVVALMSPRSLGYEETGLVSVHGRTLGEARGLCSEESFAEQPALAWCSGVLVDDDLVATAGHCLGASPLELALTCRDVAIVFGFLYDAEGQLAELSSDNVYRCRSVVAWSRSDDPATPDFGVLQLDRPVSSALLPAIVAANEVELGQRVNLIGFGSGIPAKVDSGGVVTDTSFLAEYFSADTDTFSGASGSPLFDDAGQVVGLHVRGRADWTSSGECTIAVRADEGDEVHQRASSVIRAICDANWPSPRLCATEAVCGDAICSASEPCPADCRPSFCGDGTCEGTEPSECDVDCISFSAAPAEWTCQPEYYGDRLGCDCNCGARDIDCDNPLEEVLNCAGDATCDETGRCSRSSGAGEEGGYSSGDGEPEPYDDLLVDELDLPATRDSEVFKEDGCGCRVAAAHAREPWLGAWLLLLLLRRRRAARVNAAVRTS